VADDAPRQSFFALRRFRGIVQHRERRRKENTDYTDGLENIITLENSKKMTLPKSIFDIDIGY